MTCPYELVAFDISGTLQNQMTGVLFDGIYTLLEDLKKADVKIAICTDLGNRRAHAFVAENKIEQFIDSLQHTGLHPFKPEKDMLSAAMVESLVEAPDKVCMIGDSACDIALAHAVKSDSIYVTYGGFDESVLFEEPHHVVDSVEKLRKILKV